LPSRAFPLPASSHSGPEWLHEIKHDGFRVIARKDDKRVKLYSQAGQQPDRPLSPHHRGARQTALALLHDRWGGCGVRGRRHRGFQPDPLPATRRERLPVRLIREIAEYCESDVLNTYRVWLRYELFRGRLSDAEFQGSEANLVEFVKARSNTKPHLAV
jgi:hypothetical protein